MFGIFSEGEPIKENGELVISSSIIIGDFTERLHIPISYWSLGDYKRNWISSLNQGIDNKKHSALAVSMYDPEFTNFIFVWVAYYHGDEAYFQHKIIFLNECQNFTPENINNFIGERETHNNDGMRISEWATDLNSVITFLASLRQHKFGDGVKIT
ncbi:hypothetical protein [Pantoea sp. Taur]|uniref:hypothetical protein n=1 Tax=Pantoea sp. Taur TaxID=2576757 RepID=UPI0013538E3D|nr:hypothetical protein [Pantoea sp. Taur]MXP61348.1 hypothetical protein [Pantoea sp. Taur]